MKNSLVQHPEQMAKPTQALPSISLFPLSFFFYRRFHSILLSLMSSIEAIPADFHSYQESLPLLTSTPLVLA